LRDPRNTDGGVPGNTSKHFSHPEAACPPKAAPLEGVEARFRLPPAGRLTYRRLAGMLDATMREDRVPQGGLMHRLSSDDIDLSLA